MIAKVNYKDHSFEVEIDPNKSLLESLVESGYYFRAPCGGRGVCGKCRAKLIQSSDFQQTDSNGDILLCKTKPKGDIEIELYKNDFVDFDFVVDEYKDYATLSLDIGTTTLAFSLLNRDNEEIASVNLSNPQSFAGADVLSRISYCKGGGLKKLQTVLLNTIKRVVFELKDKISGLRINLLRVCGNTVMTHIFVGTDPSNIGVYPFTPVFLDRREYKGEFFGLEVDKVVVLPCVSAYIGSDVLSGIIATKLYCDECAVLIDLGTNGEIVLKVKDKYFFTSTSAGPAFECGKISCGTSYVDGAINRVERIGEFYIGKTISDKSPVGLCATGLISLLSKLLVDKIIDKTGKICDKGRGVKEGKFYLTPEVYINQSDVREFQLAKSAILSALRVLTSKAGISFSSIEKVYIAGGLGEYLSVEDLFITNTFPKEFHGRCVSVGNSALKGACLLDDNPLIVKSILDNSVVYDLSIEEEFDKIFIDNLNF